MSTPEHHSSLSSTETVVSSKTDFVSQISESARPNGQFRLNPYLVGHVNKHYQTEIAAEEEKLIKESGGGRTKATKLAAVHRVVAKHKQAIIAEKGGEEAFMAECMKKTEEKNRLKEKKRTEKKMREIPAEVAPVFTALEQLKKQAKQLETKDNLRTVIFVASQATSTTNMSHHHPTLKSFHDNVKPHLEEHLALKDPSLSDTLVFSAPDGDMEKASNHTDWNTSRSDLRKYFRDKMKKAWGTCNWDQQLPSDLEVLNWPASIPFINPGSLTRSDQQALNAVKHNVIFVKKTLPSSLDIKTETLRHLNQLLKAHAYVSSASSSCTSSQSTQIEWLRNLIAYGMSSDSPSLHAGQVLSSSDAGTDSRTTSTSVFQPLLVSNLTL